MTILTERDNIFSPSNAIINLNKMLKKWNDYSWQCRNYLARAFVPFHVSGFLVITQ